MKTLGFMELLGLMFIFLKLMGTITWSWWLVLLPLYGPIAVLTVVLVVVILVKVWVR